jgi:hypothetical protein
MLRLFLQVNQMRRVVLIVAAIFVFTEALSVGVRADQQQVPQGQGGAPAPARQGGQGQAGQGQAGQGRQGGSNVQDVVGGVNQQQGGAQGQGRGGAGGRGRAAGPPPKPAPRDANGRAILWGFTPQEKGVWLPGSGITITTPIAKYETIPFQPWAKALYDFRQTNELEPHTRCKASGFSRQFETPYGVEFVNLPEMNLMYIFDIGGPHTYRTIYMDGRTHPANLKPAYYGHSIGWWEGDTLVVDTVGYNESFWLDRRGLPHTDKLHTQERFTRTDQATIKYETLVDDPGAYTEPWKGGFNLRWEPGTELFEYVCQQANYATELMVGDYGKVDRTSDIIP